MYLLVRPSLPATRSRPFSSFGRLLLACLVVILLALSAWAGPDSQNPGNSGDSDLLSMSLEQLMSVEVYSATKKNLPLMDTPAAVSVITNKDIMSSGATSLVDTLALAAGVQSFNINSSRHAVSIRGFDGLFASKLLVMMDGRSLYTPLFSGTYWDSQDYPLEDIDRIEVVRGPGATLWGANAMNGVINIITKSADKTLGTLVSAGFGTTNKAFLTWRDGRQIGRNFFYRTYLKYNRYGPGKTLNASQSSLQLPPANDDWSVTRAGFRSDWFPSSNNRITVSGNLNVGHSADQILQYTPNDPPLFTSINHEKISFSGYNVLAKWLYTTGEIQSTLTAYVDHTHRNQPLLFEEGRTTTDVEWQLDLPERNANSVIVGTDFRLSRDNLTNGPLFSFNPSSEQFHLLSAFVQDTITLQPNRWTLTIGSKVEKSQEVPIDYEPSVKLLFTPSRTATFWAAISRAARTPSRAERTGTFESRYQPGLTLPAVFVAEGSPNFNSERMTAYEAGWRNAISSDFSLSVSLFYDHYSDLLSSKVGTPIPNDPNNPTYLIIPVWAINEDLGNYYGGEVEFDWNATANWRLSGNVSSLRAELHKPESTPGNTTPQTTASLQSTYSVSRKLDLDLWLRYTHIDEGWSAPFTYDPNFTTLTARIAYRLAPNMELSLVGQNLLSSAHPEFQAELIDIVPTQVRRSVYGKVTVRF